MPKCSNFGFLAKNMVYHIFAKIFQCVLATKPKQFAITLPEENQHNPPKNAAINTAVLANIFKVTH